MNKTFTSLEIQAFQQALNIHEGAGLDVDGDWQEETQKAFVKWAKLKEAAVDPVGSAGRSMYLYIHAKKDLGMKEISGTASNPRILKAIREAGEWLEQDDSKTAWCGCIAGLWCKELGIVPPKDYFRAKNWLTIGTPVQLKDAVRGDVCVFKRSGGYHVALYDGHTSARVSILGGNQSDNTTITSMPVESLEGIRRIA